MTEYERLRECARASKALATQLQRAGDLMEAILSDNVESPRSVGGYSIEEAAGWAAMALRITAEGLIRLHRIHDGPGPLVFAQACWRYAAALDVAEEGRLPSGVDAIKYELARGIELTVCDTAEFRKDWREGRSANMSMWQELLGVDSASRLERQLRHYSEEMG